MAGETISDYDKRVITLMDVITKTETADATQTREMFNLHNERFKPKETGVHCAGCRSRVFNRLKEYYNSIKDGSVRV